MKARDLNPGTIGYNAAMAACSLDFDIAIGLHGEMKALNVISDEITYNTLIYTCKSSQKWREALNLLEEMESAEIIPTIFTFTPLMQTLVSADRLDEAFNLLSRIQQSSSLVKNSYVIHHMLFNACKRLEVTFFFYKIFTMENYQNNTLPR